MRALAVRLSTVSTLVLAFGWPAAARADVASWLFVGGGPSVLTRPGAGESTVGSLQIDAGLGSSPAAVLAAGGLFRLHTRFGDGTDLALFLRTATGGYVRGSWGAALDLGGYGRFWGGSSVGPAATLSLGAPWGITLNLDAAQGPDEERTFAAVLGVDFARFTVYRGTGLDWWPNPYPTPRTERRVGSR